MFDCKVVKGTLLTIFRGRVSLGYGSLEKISKSGLRSVFYWDVGGRLLIIFRGRVL